MFKDTKFLVTAAIWITGLLGLFFIVSSLVNNPPTPHADQKIVGKEFVFPEAKVDLRVQENGDLSVTEQYTYQLGGTWAGLYRDIPIEPDVQVSDVQLARISNGESTSFEDGANIELGSQGDPDTFGWNLFRSDNILRVVWHVSEADTTRIYQLKYTLKGAVKTTNDASALLFTAWGRDWKQGVGQLDISVTSPGLDYVSVRAGDLQDRVKTIKRSGDTGSVSVFDIAGGYPVQVYLRGKKLDMPVNSQDNLKAEEQRVEAFYADQARADKKWSRVNDWWLWIVLLGALPALIIVYIIWRMWGREDLSDYKEYRTDPPSNIAPAAASLIFSADDNRTFTAAILSLIANKTIRTVPAQTGDRVDLEMTYPVGKNSFEKADSKWENHLLDLVARAIEDNKAKDPQAIGVPLGQMKWDDNDWAHHELEMFIANLKGETRQERPKAPKQNEPDRLKFGLLFLVSAVVLLIYLVATYYTTELLAPRVQMMLWTVPVLASLWTLMVAVANGDAFWRYTEKDREYIEWLKYRNYFDTLANMNNEQPASVEIWEQMLCYAAAFGKADLVLKHVPLPEGYADSQLTYQVQNDSLFVTAMIAPHVIDNVNHQYSVDHKPVYSASSSSGSDCGSSFGGGGGGFSGGGSGGGGGGGW